jgi:hypothetical protein
VYEAQVTRLARRLPDLPVATRPSGIAGVYDVTDDWIPVYDCTSLAGTTSRSGPAETSSRTRRSSGSS